MVLNFIVYVLDRAGKNKEKIRENYKKNKEDRKKMTNGCVKDTKPPSS